MKEFNYNKFGNVKFGAVIIDENTIITHLYKQKSSNNLSITDELTNSPKLEGNTSAIEISEPYATIKHIYSDSKMYEYGLVCASPAMKEVIKKIEMVAKSNFTIILQGDTGTGKSLIASIIHSFSNRKDKPFVAVDMGTIPESLIESELFGHEKGAFTGATQKKMGFFEHAHFGTLFIDELQNMSPNVQSKLLSVLDEKKIYSVGAKEHINLDLRIIAATNMDIRRFVEEGKFRPDLFFRLSEFIITLPPLRERKEDIPLLTVLMVKEATDELGKDQIFNVSDEAMALLKEYHWPGNIRELKNVLRRAAQTCIGDCIETQHIDFLFKGNNTMSSSYCPPLREITERTIKTVEINAIKHALKLSGGNKSKASKMLEIDYKSFLNKIKKYSHELGS
jgi:transcriptional regulator with PAS, ATPase and Fis domain